MATDKIRKYVLPNIPYLFIGWFCLKIGTAYRLAAGTGFGEKLLGLGQTIGAAFASFAPGLAPLDWFVGIVGAAGFRLLIYYKAKKAKKFRRDAEYGTARWGNEKDIKPFVDPKFENNMLLTATERLTMNTRPKNPANARNLKFLRDRLIRLGQDPLLAHPAAFASPFFLCGGRSQGRRAGTGWRFLAAPGVQDQGVQHDRLCEKYALQSVCLHQQKEP